MYEIAKICEVRFPLTDIAMYGLTGILTYFAVSLVLPFLLALPPVLVAICTVLLTGSCIYFITYLAKEI